MPQEELSNGVGEGLDATAAGWAARVDRGLTPDESRALDAWLGESTRHRGAFARAQTAFAYFSAELDAEICAAERAEAPVALLRPQPSTANAVPRRRFLWIGAGVAGAAAASVAVLGINTKPRVVTYTAERGEIRTIPLEDGSVVTLDTASTIAVKYLPGSRNVELVGGRALFDVAKNKARPFVVTAAGLRVQAVGTSFVVRKPDSRPPEVLVQEGIVDVGQQAARAPVRVGANTRVIASINGGPALNVISLDAAAVSRELSWRKGMLAFEEASLATVAEEFARYSDARILIPDPKLAAVRITGLFAANNPLGFAHAAALSLGLTLDVKGQKITLNRS